jgi:hypothetical protein
MPLPLHPAVAHLPLGLAFAVPLVAIGIAIAHRRGRLPRAAFAVLVGLQALLVGSGVVALQLGERDEHSVERIVAESVIERHEERAEVFVWGAGAVLAGAAALLVVPAGAVGGLAAVVAAATIGVAALGAGVGHAGGEIVYVHGGADAFRGGDAAPAAAVAGRGRRDGRQSDDHD